MKPRVSSRFLALVATLTLLLSGLAVHSLMATAAAQPALAEKSGMVRDLELTDLCLFTEASYTRHLSMTDSFTPFQDSPLAFEHFPSGALAAPPAHLMRDHGKRH